MTRVYLILFVFLIFSCVDDELCTGEATNIVKIDFYDLAAPDTQIEVTFTDIQHSGYAEAFPVYADSTLSSINLTVDPNSPETIFIMQTDGRSDTLTMTYDIVPFLISPACGPQISFNNLDVATHTFDSLNLLSPLFTEGANTNIAIYY